MGVSIPFYESNSENNFTLADTTIISGAYAEYIAVSTHMLIHKPDHLSWEEAAGIPEVYSLSIHLSSEITD